MNIFEFLKRLIFGKEEISLSNMKMPQLDASLKTKNTLDIKKKNAFNQRGEDIKNDKIKPNHKKCDKLAQDLYDTSDGITEIKDEMNKRIINMQNAVSKAERIREAKKLKELKEKHKL